MANSRVLYLGDGQTVRFAIPFPYLSPTHVHVYVNKSEQLNPLNWSFDGDGFAVLTKAPAVKDAVEIIRLTESDIPLSQFQDGSILTEAELNLATLQNLYLNQELRDYMDALLNPAVSNIASNLGVVGATAGEVIDAVVQGILDSQLLADLQQRITDIDTNANMIAQQVLATNQITTAIENINGVAAPIATLVQNETNARVEGDNALIDTVALLGAKSDDNLAFVLDTNTVKVSPTESLADHFSAVLAQADDYTTAAVTQEQSARATADAALSTRVDTVVATANSNAAAIQTEQTARADADSALSTRVDTVVANVGANSAAIQTEQTARADGDTALASSVSTLQTKVDGNTASISTIQTVQNGIKAEYMVKLDVNGYVSGFGLYNEAASAEFLVLADKFAVVTPGQNPIVPFAVDANGVYMDNAYIRNLAVDKITGGAIKNFWTINDGTGRIVLDNGTFMKVLGAGFGLNHDLIEWFGPHMDVGACTRANAITYVATDGDAYFGGSLSAGTLYNAASGTSVTIGAQTQIGPYATNGNVKTVVLSYVFSDFTDPVTSGSGNGSEGLTATVDLYRTIGSQSEAKVATLTATGTHSWSTESDGRRDYWNISGSLTFTDNITGLDSRTYRAVVSARPNTQTVSTVHQIQKVSIISTEQ